MHFTTQKIKAPYIGASFALLLLATNIIGMEPKFKQRLLADNSHEIHIPMPTSDVHIPIEPRPIEDYDIWQEKEVNLISYVEDEKCPRIYGLTIEDRLCICWYEHIYGRLCRLIGTFRCVLCCK